MSKEEKQFPLDSRDNCCIYLCRIISSCELGIGKLKRYNSQAKAILDEYHGKDTVPYDTYEAICDKSYCILSYLLNLLGDCQTSSISYFKYRQHIQKRINRGNHDIPLYTMSQEVSEIITEFNRMRNWQNHVPESLLVAEMELVRTGKMVFPMDPVRLIHYKSVTYEYFEHLYLSNMEFYENARKVIQTAKREYSMLMGKNIQYQKVFVDEPLSVEKSKPAIQSARVQGLHTKEEN